MGHPYVNLARLVLRTFARFRVQWAHVAVLYAFVAVLGSRVQLDLQRVVVLLWNHGLERFIRTHRWHTFLSLERAPYSFFPVIAGMLTFTLVFYYLRGHSK